MSNIDKRALREAAERAGQNDWEYVYTSDLSAPGRGYITVGGAEAIYCLNKAAGGVKQSENVLRYIAAASPETMLALLNEIAELEQRHCGTALLEREEMHTKTLGRMLDELDAKDRRIAELELKLEAAEKRIAELEAREVKLPNPHAHLIWIQAGHAPDDYWDDVAVSHSEKDKCCDGSDRYPVYALWEIKEALSAIGINIAAAGKGEDS
ncbi:ead/Ea22-like family protein [Enterobacter kobei]|uniref:ead/Ea22-like family protein n=1 Tax=Enterobacter kobei TaxID=208224 RepID=UPI0018691149|nr:ead/Ea22-like family protein [Enterobacter kobei]EKS6750254.1 ead/Ea22-like family protein [Enterobacter kobei]MDK9980792.1 ead/Ea22-like family protein [Enterobacter kobei]